MSGSAHSNTSQQWLIFFFVCFGMSVLAIGVWAAFNNQVGGDGYVHSGPATSGGH
jgi:hypothetical protein